MDVTVDWNSVDSVNDLDLQRQLIHILAGDVGSALLAGLASAMDSCLSMLKDMAYLVNRRSAQQVKEVLSQTKTVMVKFVKDLPTSRRVLDLPLEPRAMWYFSLDKEGGLVYNTSLFPLYIFTSVAHVLFTCLAHPLRRFPDPPASVWSSAFTPEPEPPEESSDVLPAYSDNKKDSSTSGGKSLVGTNVSEGGGTNTALSDVTGDGLWSCESPREDGSRLGPSQCEVRLLDSPALSEHHQHSHQHHQHHNQPVQLVEVDDDSGVVLDFAWQNFSFLHDVKNLLRFIRNDLSREVERVSDTYAALQPLDLGINTLAIRTVFGSEGAGLSLKNGVLTVSLHCYCPSESSVWEMGFVDPDSFFFEKRTQHLCNRWRTGSMQISASFDQSTRRLTRALGFPVALPVAGQTTLELLCRVEGGQMTHPYELLKQLLKTLSRHVTAGYLDAVTTALSFSGHCWLIGRADVPSTLWCWVRQSDVSRRKPGERYLVLSRSEHGKSLFHTMKGSDVLQSTPGALAGVWHKHDHGIEGSVGVMMKDMITDRVQLVTVNGHVFFTGCSRATFRFMSSLPLAVEIGMATESPLTKALWFDDVFLRPIELGYRNRQLACTSPSTTSMMQCWQMACSLGFHLVFDLQDITSEDHSLKEKRCYMSSLLMLETLQDITDVDLCGTEMVDIVKKLLKYLGTVTVSHKLVDKALHIVRGGMYGEEVNVYLLTEKDLQIAPLHSIWDRSDTLTWPRPFTESLRTTLCAAFSLQTRSQLSNLLHKKLSRKIVMDDISFIQFAERSDKLQTLAMSHKAVTGFLEAFTHFVERYVSGMRKLKSDLTSVMFTEEISSGPVVSLQSGVLRVGLFKVCKNLVFFFFSFFFFSVSGLHTPVSK